MPKKATEKVVEKTTDIFADEEANNIEAEAEKDFEATDDLVEGFKAEADPATVMNERFKSAKDPAYDAVGQSLDGQLTALGRRTAEELAKMPKHKVIIPGKELNPHDSFVVVGINGWNIQVKRDVPVMLPDIVIEQLANAGENPTLVR